MTEETTVENKGAPGAGNDPNPTTEPGERLDSPSPPEPVEAELRWPDPDSSVPGTSTFSESELRFFFNTGIRPGAPGEPVNLHPATLHPYLHTEKFRNPWPLLMHRTAVGLEIRTLPAVIDSAIDALAGEGDALEIRKRALFQLEKCLRDACEGEEATIPLKGVLHDATEAILSSVNGRKDRYDDYKSAVETFQTLLAHEVRLIPYGFGPSFEMLQALSDENTSRNAAVFKEEIDYLKARLSDILQVEDTESGERLTEDHLQHSVGGAFVNELDFSSLSHLLEKAPHGPAMPADRRIRVEQTLTSLREASALAFGTDEAPALNDLDASLAEAQLRHESFTRLIRSVQIARLESENKYRPERHDRIFELFSEDLIDDATLALRRPVLVGTEALSPSFDPLVFQALLEHPWPVCCMVSVDRLLNDGGRLKAQARMALSLVSRGDVFVGQCGLSRPSLLAELATHATSTAANTLVMVYPGSRSTDVDLPPFLDSALASDSRMFPVFSYVPGPDSDWADRFSASNNEQADATWPLVALSGLLEESEIAVTPVDFIATDQRFVGRFLPISPDVDSELLMELGAFLERPRDEQSGFIPYLVQATVDGLLVRSIVSRQVLKTVTAAHDQWRIIQEWSGLRSSVAARQIESAREELQQEHEDALSQTRDEYDSRLNESASSIARQVVENIAAGLLGVSDIPAVSPTAVSPASSKAHASSTPQTPEAQVAASEPEAPEPEEEDDLGLSLDEAYIDTPLCTSCNECTDLNGLMFAYDENKQAYIKDVAAGSYRELVLAAEKCPARIIHPGKPTNPKEPNLEEWVERAGPFR